jgi:hypothetical protein
MSDTSILKGELEKLVEQAGIVMEDNHSMKGLLELRSSELVAKDAEIKALREAIEGLFEYLNANELLDCGCVDADLSVGIEASTCEVCIARAALCKEATK